MKRVFVAVCFLLSVVSLTQAYYYNEDGEVEDESGFESGLSRARLYTRSVKSPPPSPARIKSYTPPSPSRARLVAPSPVKGYEQQRIEQQSYEAPVQQQPVPIIQHEVVGQPEPYNFNYDVKDEYGNSQFRREDSDNTGTVRGSYGYTDANGLYRVVDYVADENGFRASIRTNEPGLSEPSPTTGEVLSPASVTLSAEATPARVREQQLRYTSQSSSGLSGGSAASISASSYGGSSSSIGSTSSSSSSSSYDRLQQQQLPIGRSGTKYRA